MANQNIDITGLHNFKVAIEKQVNVLADTRTTLQQKTIALRALKQQMQPFGDYVNKVIQQHKSQEVTSMEFINGLIKLADKFDMQKKHELADILDKVIKSAEV